MGMYILNQTMSTIYITDIQTKIKLKSPYLLVFHNQELRQKININQVSQIVLWGRCYLPREVASLALFRHIPILFVGNNGENLGRLEHRSKQQPQCLKYQKRRSLDHEFTFATAESIVRAKLHNCYVILQRLTTNKSTPIIKIASDLLLLLIDDLPMANSIYSLREYVTMAASFYYPALASLLPCGFGFKGRKKQPPTDGINCLLNLGYSLLHQKIEVLLQDLELHPNWGNLYSNSHHQSPLACDFMAEFRAPIVDELVTFLVMSEILTPSDFLPDAKQGGVSLNPGILKVFFQYWEDKLQTQVIHHNAGKVSYRHCLQLQLKEYIASLVGNTVSYRPMLLPINSPSADVHPTEKQETKVLSLVKR